MHESAHAYQGMEWAAFIWVWAQLPFGFAPACRLYTLLKEEVYYTLREWGARMTFLIYDQAGLVTWLTRAKF